MKLIALSTIRNAVRSHMQALFNLVVMPEKKISVSLEHETVTDQGDIKAEIKNSKHCSSDPGSSRVLLLNIHASGRNP